MSEELWSDDLLGRRDEAAMIINYIEGATAQAMKTRTKGAVTLAVDAGYGAGKTFFLQRLADEIRGHHPVAFVDAWKDDLADEPLIALVATLASAIEPLASVGSGVVLTGRLQSVMDKAGQIAKLASFGLLRRAAGMAISATAVEAIEAAWDEIPDVAFHQVEELGSDAAAGLDRLLSIPSSLYMKSRVDAFRTGQEAIRELKEELGKLVEALAGSNYKPPLVIIIDELDRCRPNYAIKLLEEIKHLFDVPGLAFILGMHGEQLSHAVKAAYGPSFKGEEYLRRFMRRRYVLQSKSKEKLTSQAMSEAALAMTDGYPFLIDDRPKDLPFSAVFNHYVESLLVTPRELQQLAEILETAYSVANGVELINPLLVPLAVGEIRGEQPHELRFAPTGRSLIYNFRRESGHVQYSPQALMNEIIRLGRLSVQDLNMSSSSDHLSFLVLRSMLKGEEKLTAVQNYPRLLANVGKMIIN
ncbi:MULTISPECIES: KAP family NTPase [unclassified Sphingobium]|uniref:KAP family P-loop NTPase fold protein n=1 Tax=unclassified Sphingobium TaxID=2611147 RepID=UPI00222473C2|nr:MULTISPECIES: KAP family NTPase [unclassified Sphingobium]MCW2412018.1 hypothetical protein [Sphingobium sp. B8D3D]MCW2415684.1 hypothetical protein [Sphingobium sp. B8D3A]